LLHNGNSYYGRLALEEVKITRHRSRTDVVLLSRILDEKGFVEAEYCSHHRHDASTDDLSYVSNSVLSSSFASVFSAATRMQSVSRRSLGII